MYKLYYIKGYDQIYCGLHGMETSRIIECENDDEAIDWGRDLSQDVIESYSNIYEELEEEVLHRCAVEGICYKDDGPIVDNIRDEVYQEDLAYEVDLLDSNELPSFDIDELEDLLWEMGDVEFRKKFTLIEIC